MRQLQAKGIGSILDYAAESDSDSPAPTSTAHSSSGPSSSNSSSGSASDADLLCSSAGADRVVARQYPYKGKPLH